MSKRKTRTSVTSAGRGTQSVKPPKKARLSGFDGTFQSPKLGHLSDPEDSEDHVGPVHSTEQSGEELRLTAPSIPDETTEVPSRHPGQPEKDPVPVALSQNSAGKFVPQFAKPRKTVPKKAETEEEDIGSGAFTLELLQEPSASQAGSQQLQGSRVLALPEAQAQTAGANPAQCSQRPQEPALCSVTSVLMTSDNTSPSRRTIPSTSDMASLEQLSQSETCALDGGNTALESSLLAEWQRNIRPNSEQDLAPGDPGQNGPSSSSESQRKEPQRQDCQEEGKSFTGTLDPTPAPAPPLELSPISLGPEPGLADQGCPDHMQMPVPSEPVVIIAVRSTDSIVPPLGAPEMATLDGQASDRSQSRVLPYSLETTRGQGEAELEDEPPSNSAGLPAASQAPDHENQEPMMGAGNSGPLAPEVSAGINLKQLPSLTQEGPEDMCALPSPVEPVSRNAAETGIDSLQDPQALGHVQSLQAMSLLESREVDGPSQGPSGHTASDLADQAIWGCSSTMELDFLPDSQIQNILDAPNSEASPEQLSPPGCRQNPCWPGTNPHANGNPITSAQPRNLESGIQTILTPELEDATDTVCGLIMELSNLNRMIMSTHRDLEAVRRLSYQKLKRAAKAPAPCASKGTGPFPRGEQPWRDG